MIDSLAHLALLIIVLTALFAIPSALVEWMRQRGQMRKEMAELQAWREAQQRAQDEHSRTYDESVRLQREAHTRAEIQQEAYLRSVTLQEAGIKLAEARLEEARKTNVMLETLIAELQERRRT
jgi:Sec-independent protein translocase protein TatA